MTDKNLRDWLKKVAGTQTAQEAHQEEDLAIIITNDEGNKPEEIDATADALEKIRDALTIVANAHDRQSCKNAG